MRSRSWICEASPGLRLGGERGAAARDRHDRVADLLARGLLREVTLGAGGDGSIGELWLHERREEEDLGFEALAAHRRKHLRAVQPWHADVEHGYLRAQALDLVERVAAVGGLAHKLELGPVFDGPNDALAIDRVIVRDQDLYAFVPSVHASGESRPCPSPNIREARRLSPRPSVTSD